MADILDELTAPQREEVAKQIAEVFALIQGIEIPSTVDEFGGLVLDDRGNVVVGPMVTCDVAPMRRYSSLLLPRIRAGMEEAEAHSAIRGWCKGGFGKDVQVVAQEAAMKIEAISPELSKKT